MSASTTIARVLAASPRLTASQLAVIRHASSMPVEEVDHADA